MNNDHGFRERMLQRTDQELLDIVQGDRTNYQPEAIRDAEIILTERGVAFTASGISVESKPADVDYNYWPAIVGGIMVAAALFGFSLQIDQDSATAVNVFVTLLFRVVVVAWNYELCTKYDLKKGLWITLGVLFGGWALIAINIAIATRQSPDDSKATLFGVPPEEEQDTQ